MKMDYSIDLGTCYPELRDMDYVIDEDGMVKFTKVKKKKDTDKVIPKCCENCPNLPEDGEIKACYCILPYEEDIKF